MTLTELEPSQARKVYMELLKKEGIDIEGWSQFSIDCMIAGIMTCKPDMERGLRIANLLRMAQLS